MVKTLRLFCGQFLNEAAASALVPSNHKLASLRPRWVHCRNDKLNWLTANRKSDLRELGSGARKRDSVLRASIAAVKWLNTDAVVAGFRLG